MGTDAMLFELQECWDVIKAKFDVRPHLDLNYLA